MHEQHVGVAAVAHLGPAEPAHPDHREPGRQRAAPLGLDRPAGRLERPDEGGHGHVGERRPDRGDVETAQQVGDGHPEQLPTPYGAHRADRLDRVLAAPHPGQHLAEQAGPVARGQLVVVGEHRHGLRRPQQQVGDQPAGGEQVGHPLGGLRPRRAAAAGTSGWARAPR